MNLKILYREGGDVAFLVPWKGKEIQVKWEEPIGCLNGGFQFDMNDDDEAEEFEEFLWSNVEVSTSVVLNEGNKHE